MDHDYRRLTGSCYVMKSVHSKLFFFSLPVFNFPPVLFSLKGLDLLDRSGYGKVYPLITRRRFQQMEVLEGQNILVTISGPKNRVRVYYLSWLKGKILKTDGVSYELID